MRLETLIFCDTKTEKVVSRLKGCLECCVLQPKRRQVALSFSRVEPLSSVEEQSPLTIFLWSRVQSVAAVVLCFGEVTSLAVVFWHFLLCFTWLKGQSFRRVQ